MELVKYKKPDGNYTVRCYKTMCDETTNSCRKNEKLYEDCMEKDPIL